MTTDKNSVAAKETTHGMEDFWSDMFAEPFKKIAFHYDIVDKRERKPTTLSFRLQGEPFVRLMKISKDSDILLNVLLTAGIFLLLEKYTSAGDIILGIPVGRTNGDGPAVNSFLPLRLQLDGTMTFKQLLLKTGDLIKAAVRNRNYPMARLLRSLNLEFLKGDDFPLFDIVTALENSHQDRTPQDVVTNVQFVFKRQADAIELDLHYNAALFSAARMMRLGNHVLALLEQVPANPDAPVGAFELLSPQEKQQLLAEFNQSAAAFPRHETVTGLFSRQVEKTPENSAVVMDGKQLTYKQLDRNLRLVPLGVPGELCVGGEGVCRGYLGRIDDQDKIRDNCIELGEIEAHLLTHDRVHEAAVIVMEDDGGNKSLCAYVTFKKDSGLFDVKADIEDIMIHLQRSLPESMIPAHLIYLEKMPLTPNGKIDYENFFELGGHSLRATVVSSRIHTLLNLKSSLAELFNRPTIADLTEYIKTASQSAYAAIEPAPTADYYPLSSAQLRLFILQQMDPDSIGYNMPGVISIGQELEWDRMEQAFRILINRHESLRTTFVKVNDEPQQKIHEVVSFEVVHYIGQKIDRIVQQFIRPFDLGKAPLFRVGLISLPARSLLMVDMHHIISDAVSQQVLEEEFVNIYTGVELPPLRLQYKDYAYWQSSSTHRQKLLHQESFWLDHFSGELPVLDLPTDFIRPAVRSFEGDTMDFTLGETETRTLRKIAGDSGTTLYIVLLAVFNIFLSRLSGQDDIVVGTPIAGRRHTDLERILGMFVNTLAIRNFPAAAKSFSAFLAEVKQRTLAAFENQEYQFEDLVDKLSLRPDTSRNPIFDVMFNLLKPEDVDESFKGVEKELSILNKTAKFDVNLRCIDNGKILLLNLEYRSRLFMPESIRRFIGYFKQIVNSVSADPAMTIAEIRLIDPALAESKTAYFNQDLLESVPVPTIQTMLSESFRRRAAAVAIEYGDRRITYAQLQKRAAAVTGRLLADDLPRGVVGAYLENIADMIAVMIGIFNAGCIYVPLDVSLPIGRVAEIAVAANIDALFTDIADTDDPICLVSRLGAVQRIPLVVWVNEDFFQSPPRPQRSDVRLATTDKLYVYFTSGSTGRPNGVVGRNGSLAQFIRWEIDTFNVDETYRVSQFAAPGFDAFLRNVLTPLCAGAVVCIPYSWEVVMDAGGLVRFIRDNNLTLMHCVPRLFRLICSNPLTAEWFTTLKYIVMSGEQINPFDLQRWYAVFADRVQLVNCYGATETTVIKTCHMIRPQDSLRQRIPVGHAMRGARVILLDDNGAVCAPGIAGEVYVRTVYGTYGYLDNPELDSLRFVKKTPGSGGADLVYRTGDIGRELEDGTLEIIGRKDRQIKIRGIRIEIEGIENLLLEIPGISEAVVVQRFIGKGDSFLCAYYTGTVLEAGDIKKQLAKVLPAYMLPTFLVPLDKIPRTSTGKIDRRSLPEPKVGIDRGADAPVSEVQRNLVEIWARVLNIEPAVIGINSNFFDIGGHSLKVTVLASSIHLHLGVKIPLTELFKQQTIAEQAEYIGSARKDEVLHEHQAYWVRRFAQLPPTLKLPTDFARPAVQSFAGDSVPFKLDAQQSKRLKQLAAENDATVFMILTALFNVFLAKISGLGDIVIGTPVEGRRHADLEGIIGMFVNMLVLRNFPTPEKTFAQFLQEVRQYAVEAFENQEYPLESLVEQLNIQRDPGRNPLFDVVFSMIINPDQVQGIEVDEQQSELLPVKTAAKFDVTLYAGELGDVLAFSFDYNTKLFKKETINRFVASFKEIVDQLSPQVLLKDITVSFDSFVVTVDVDEDDYDDFDL